MLKFALCWIDVLRLHVFWGEVSFVATVVVENCAKKFVLSGPNMLKDNMLTVC